MIYQGSFDKLWKIFAKFSISGRLKVSTLPHQFHSLRRKYLKKSLTLVISLVPAFTFYLSTFTALYMEMSFHFDELSPTTKDISLFNFRSIIFVLSLYFLAILVYV